MTSSLLNPLACGFAKVAVFSMLKDDAQLTYENHLQRLNKKVFEIGKKSAADKAQVLEKFSISEWTNLSDAKKKRHSIFDCQACLQDDSLRSELRKFPIKDWRGKARATEGGLFRPLKDEIQKETSQLVMQLNSKYKKDFGTTFDYQYRICKGQKTKGETRKDIVKEVVEDIQKQNNETIVTRVSGTRTSLATHNDNRKLVSHESFEKCLGRTSNQKERSARDHAGNTKNYSYDENVFDKVRSFPRKTKINYSKLAEEYNLKHRITNKVPANGGQIMELILEESDIDMSQFEKLPNSGPRRRRAKRKILDTSVPVPSDETSLQIQSRMHSYIETGKYSAGEMIVPQQYERLVMKDGLLTIEVVEISGRKFVLDDIPEKLLKKHSRFIRVKPDSFYEQMTPECLKFELEVRLREKLDDTKDATYLKQLHRTRSFACWHDTSSVSNAFSGVSPRVI